MTTRYNEVSVTDVPEVLEVKNLEAEFEAFRNANPQYFAWMDDFAERYNAALVAAEKTVRARQVTCGNFILYQFATTYDPDALFDHMGHETALAVGGIESTRTVRSVDKARVDSAIAAGTIPSHIAAKVRKKQGRYKKPKSLELP